MTETNDLFEIMRTTRAMRRLKPDPVPDELIVRILQAGNWAPNGSNMQSWGFLVIKDRKIKEAVQEIYARAHREFVGPMYASAPTPPGVDPARFKRQHDAVKYLTDHFADAPVWIVACIRHSEKNPPNRTAGASIYPAVQNMLLAARALGLGATLTTRNMIPTYEKETEAALRLPAGVHCYAILPIGWPMGTFGPVGRGPLSEVVFQDAWGQPYGAVASQ